MVSNHVTANRSGGTRASWMPSLGNFCLHCVPLEGIVTVYQCERVLYWGFNVFQSADEFWPSSLPCLRLTQESVLSSSSIRCNRVSDRQTGGTNHGPRAWSAVWGRLGNDDSGSYQRSAACALADLHGVSNPRLGEKARGRMLA